MFTDVCDTGSVQTIRTETRGECTIIGRIATPEGEPLDNVNVSAIRSDPLASSSVLLAYTETTYEGFFNLGVNCDIDYRINVSTPLLPQSMLHEFTASVDGIQAVGTESELSDDGQTARLADWKFSPTTANLGRVTYEPSDEEIQINAEALPWVTRLDYDLGIYPPGTETSILDIAGTFEPASLRQTVFSDSYTVIIPAELPEIEDDYTVAGTLTLANGETIDVSAEIIYE